MGRVSPQHARPVLVVLAAGMAKRYGGCKPLAPVGLHGEAVVDLTASDALAAGFGEVVLVLGPHTGAAIEYHVQRCWPPAVKVSVALQTEPLGTAHAVLCARPHVGERPFAVVNADDVYGTPAFELLLGHLSAHGEHALVAYRLADTVVTDEPVTRGTCAVDPDGLLAGIAERRKVQRQADGTFVAGDGAQPERLDPDTLVSVNLWGLQPEIWPVLEAAVRAVHRHVAPDGSLHPQEAPGDPGALGSVPAPDGPGAPASLPTPRSDPPTHGGPPLTPTSAEVLLPEVMGAVAGRPGATGGTQPVRVLRGPGRCIGVTHADDLPIVRRELAASVGRGERPEWLWRQLPGR